VFQNHPRDPFPHLPRIPAWPSHDATLSRIPPCGNGGAVQYQHDLTSCRGFHRPEVVPLGCRSQGVVAIEAAIQDQLRRSALTISHEIGYKTEVQRSKAVGPCGHEASCWRTATYLTNLAIYL